MAMRILSGKKSIFGQRISRKNAQQPIFYPKKYHQFEQQPSAHITHYTHSSRRALVNVEGQRQNIYIFLFSIPFTFDLRHFLFHYYHCSSLYSHRSRVSHTRQQKKQRNLRKLWRYIHQNSPVVDTIGIQIEFFYTITAANKKEFQVRK